MSLLELQVIVASAVVNATPSTDPDNRNQAVNTLKAAVKKRTSAFDNKPKSEEAKQKLMDDSYKLFAGAFGAIERKNIQFRKADNALLAQSYVAYAEFLFWKNGDLNKSCEYFTKAEGLIKYLPKYLRAELYSEWGSALIKLATQLEAAGKKGDALARFNEGIQKLNIALTNLDLKKPYELKERKQQINYTMAWVILYKLNDPARALEYFNRSLQDVELYGAMQYVDVSKIYMGLGDIYSSDNYSGRDEATAIAKYEEVIDPRNKKTLPHPKLVRDPAVVPAARARIGEIKAIQILNDYDKKITAEKKDDKKKELIAKRDQELQQIVSDYFVKSGNSKAKIWICRINVITAGENKGKLSTAKKDILDILKNGKFDKADIPEANYLLADVSFRIEVLNAEGQRDFTKTLGYLEAVIANPDATERIKARAYLLKAKILQIQNKLTEAVEVISKARAAAERSKSEPVKLEQAFVDEIAAEEAKIKFLDVVKKFEGAEALRYGENQNHAEAVKKYEALIPLLEAINTNDAKLLLAKVYFGLAELRRYGTGTTDLLKAVEYYNKAIDIASRITPTNEDADNMAAFAKVALGKAYLGLGELYRCSQPDPDKAIASYNEAIKRLTGIPGVEAQLYLARAYFGLGEMYRYGMAKPNPAEALKNYEKAIELTSTLSDPQAFALLGLSYLGKGKVLILQEKYSDALKAYLAAESRLTAINDPVAEFEIYAGLAMLYGMGNRPDPASAQASLVKAKAALKKIPEGTLSGRKDIQALAEQIKEEPFRTPEYTRLMLEVGYVSVNGEQTSNDTTTEQSRSGLKVILKAPLKTRENSSYSAQVTFESLTVKAETPGHFALYKEDEWDDDGNPTHYATLDSQDLPILEAKSFQRVKAEMSYWRKTGRFSFWVTPGFERFETKFNTVSHTWADYVNDFNNPVANRESGSQIGFGPSLRAHMDWNPWKLGDWRVQLNGEVYWSTVYTTQASAYDSNTRAYIELLGQNAGSNRPDIVDGQNSLSDLEDQLENKPRTSWYVQPGTVITAPWRVMGGGETKLDLKFRIGADPIGDSSYVYYPVTDAMEAIKYSPNFTLRQSAFFRGWQATAAAFYNQDFSSKGKEGSGYYWGLEATARINALHVKGFYPEFFISYSASDSESNYSQSSVYGGIRVLSWK